MNTRDGQLPDAKFQARVVRTLGRTPHAWRRAERGLSLAESWIVSWRDGTSAFVKAAVDYETAEWLRVEHLIYSRVRGGFLPKLHAWSDRDDHPVLVLEDLSAAVRTPPWSPERVSQVRGALAAIAATRAPEGLPEMEELRELFSGWTRIQENPEPFLALGACPEIWLAEALPGIVAAEQRACLKGDELAHLDVRSDNLCFVHDRAVLFDWSWARKGNGLMDLAMWLPSLSMEGGPAPHEVLPDQPELAAVISGFFAFGATEPAENASPGRQLRQLREVVLPWLVTALDLPPIPSSSSVPPPKGHQRGSIGCRG